MASLLSKIVPALRGAPTRAIHTSSVVNAIFKIQNPEEFDEKVLKSKTPVVVDFYAAWVSLPSLMYTQLMLPFQMVRPLQDAHSPNRIRGDWSEGGYIGQGYNTRGSPIRLSLLNNAPLYNHHSLQVDIDEHNDLAFDFDVSSVPVLVGMKNGKEVARMVGLQDTDKLKKFVETIASKWCSLLPSV